MEFRVDLNNYMRILNGFYRLMLLASSAIIINKYIPEGLVIERLIEGTIFILILALALFMAQKLQENRYMQCSVKLDEKGIFIRDLSRGDKYFFYEDIKYICMSADEHHAFVIGHNKKYATILSQTKDYSILIDKLKKKNITFVKKGNYFEQQRHEIGYGTLSQISGLTKASKVVVLMIILTIVSIVMQIIKTSL